MGEVRQLEAGSVRTSAYVAGEMEPGVLGVALFHPWWGLNADVLAFADRLASEGFIVVAPDLFAGPDFETRSLATTIDQAEALASGLDEPAADAIALAALDLVAETMGPGAKLGTIGFSLGAAWALWSGAQRDRVAATVVYYGSMGGPSLARSQAHVLGHFAETDPYEPAEQVQEFEAALEAAGRKAFIRDYPGTGHWFAEPSQEAFRAEAAELAFRRSLSFLRENLS